ncbi:MULTISPECIES: TonB-dependent hemoglobin/transferrin/lactoferrin family receptor [unclassified Acinetobacter]|uniref:TonB-dependent hemoglobin/transferrin/lactoferrin family receptor n=1 Tax=unclassified Acinetobacter TaxID=196816 RepID=UPI0035B7E2DB
MPTKIDRKRSLLTVVVATLMSQAAYAQTEAQVGTEKVHDLGTITIVAEQSKNKTIAKEVIDSEQLSRQMALDNKDIIRYQTGVTVVEAGRFGHSGYAIRGVDENRVAITVDGLHQAETLSSQGFKELFEGYGNFNNTRNGVEVEHLKRATINKGADSVISGSGALGGSVAFESKDASDLLTDKDYHIGYKTGYSTADNQKFQSISLAGQYKWLDAMIIHTRRNGHETENFGYKNYDDYVQGREREKADPYRKKLNSTLMKLSLSPNEDNKLTLTADMYETSSRGHDFSYTLQPNTQWRTYDELELRHTGDSVKRNNYMLNFENSSSNLFYDSVKVGFSNQNIRMRARTDDYCDGHEKCPSAQNPLGMKYNSDNKLVGNDNKPAVYVDTTNVKAASDDYITVEVGVVPYDPKIHPDHFRWRRVKPELIDTKLYQIPESFSCANDSRIRTVKPNDTSPCELYVQPVKQQVTLEKTFTISGTKHDLLANTNIIGDDQMLRTNTPIVLSCAAINCNKNEIMGFDPKTGNPVAVKFEVFERNGQKFAKTEKQNASQLDAPVIFVPGKPGYNDNIWSQRDLVTKTKQANIDFTKSFDLGSTAHQLKYGALWSRTDKHMINETGSNAINTQWWAVHPNDCSANVGNVDRYNALCNNSNVYSFLIPVRANAHALYLNDKVSFNDKFSLNWAYRYDSIKYQPKYQEGVTPRIPDDMVTNLYVQDPSFDATNLTSPENMAKRTANANANIAQIAQPKSYSAHSYALGTNYDVNDWLNLQARYSKAFRAPTGEEIYFTFKHPDFSILPNRDLKAEDAKTKELAFTLHNQLGFITTSVFQTNYRDFIDLEYRGGKQLQGHSMLRPFQTYQNVNRQNATVKGLEINSRLELASLSPALEGLHLTYKNTMQKGRVNGNMPMNAIQPRTAVYGLGYDHPSEKFGADLYITDVAAKKAQDTYNMFHKEEGAKDTFVKWRSSDYTVLDLTGYVKLGNHSTLKAGVYNLLNNKYLTWDSARSIRSFGTSNMINRETGAGIQRFYAPERNYRMAVEVKF